MKIAVQLNIPVEQIKSARKLDQVAKMGANLVARRADKRVPMASGTLKNTRMVIGIGENQAELVYPQPYAHYHYLGQAMAGTAPKRYTGAAMNYSQAPTRGPKWIERTMQEDGDMIVRDLARRIGGKPK